MNGSNFAAFSFPLIFPFVFFELELVDYREKSLQVRIPQQALGKRTSRKANPS